MEDYHQETGRLSRDGKKGIAICVTSPDFVDKYMQRCSDVSARQRLDISQDCRRERLTTTFINGPLLARKLTPRDQMFIYIHWDTTVSIRLSFSNG